MKRLYYAWHFQNQTMLNMQFGAITKLLLENNYVFITVFDIYSTCLNLFVIGYSWDANLG
jgi:hypothetical protein